MLDDDPEAPDGASAVATSNTTVGQIDLEFADPATALTPGPGLQVFRVAVRKTAASGSNNATIDLLLAEAGQAISQPATAAVTSTSWAVVEYAWDAATVTDPGAVQLRVTTGNSGGGKASKRAAADVGAVEWVAAIDGGDTTPPDPPAGLTITITD